MKLRKILIGVLALTYSLCSSQDFNYGEALQKSILFYEAQQSGPLPDWNRVSWRGDSAVNDGSDVGVDLTGGWYDAGDNVKFNFPMAYSATILAWGAIEYPEAYDSSGQMEHLLNNLRFVNDYFIKCHTGPTELYGQVANGTLDHAWWGSPEVVHYVMERPSYKIDAENPGSDLAAETASAMAASSILFADSDPVYSAELLDHAIELYQFADDYRGVYSDSITDAATFYRSWSGYNDEIVWGAIWLYRATGDESYLQKAISEYSNLGTEIGTDDKAYKWGLAWDDKSYGCYVLLSLLTGDSEYMADAERHLDFWTDGYNGERIAYSPGGQAHLTNWGSLRHSSNTSLLALIYSDKVIPNTDKASVYHDFAVDQIDYALGENPLNRSFMVGFGNDPAHSVHHRAAHGSWGNSWAEPVETSHILYGALAGGPSAPDDEFEDDRNDYIANEVACDYNAGLTGALARLYDEYGGDPLANFPEVEEPTREEIRTVSTFQSTNPYGSTVKSLVENRTAWPARVTDMLTYKYFIDITEAVEAGYSIDDYTISVGGGGQESSVFVKGIETWDAELNIYAIVISLEGDEIVPIGDPQYRRDCQISISVANGVPYDHTNDWSAEGLEDSEVETPKIPVYENGVLVFGEEPPGGDTPKAVFTATPETGFAPLEVSFNSSDSSDPNGDSISYTWDFGNGETSTMANPTITFEDFGTFEVSLIVSDGTNESYPYTMEIEVLDSNIAPIAVISSSATSGIAPFEIDFSASDSSDENEDTLSYSWNFGDGSTSTMENVSHTFDTAGEYEVVLTVSDGAKTDVDRVIITLNDGSPVVSYTYSTTDESTPFTVNFDASNSTDPEGGDLSFAWNFGNLNTGTGATPTATYFSQGEYLITLTVTNESGKETMEEFYIELGPSVCDYNTPISTVLPSINEDFAHVHIIGEEAPVDLYNITTVSFNWDLQNNSLHNFGINVNVAPNYINVGSAAFHNFGSTEPSISILNSGLDGLDGDYYVAEHEGNFVMVSQGGEYAIYFSNSSTAPNCPDQTLSIPHLDLANYEIAYYPNPASDILNVAVKTVVDFNVSVKREIVILNLLGQEVLKKEIAIGESISVLDIQDLSSGIYLIQVKANDQQIDTNKLVIE